MLLTRKEREKAVLDLYYNQGKNIREIAREARMSFRDIGAILNKADEEREQKATTRTTTAGAAISIYTSL
jgi:transposase